MHLLCTYLFSHCSYIKYKKWQHTITSVINVLPSNYIYICFVIQHEHNNYVKTKVITYSSS